jgi:NtrC-family two-component system response regulator AlgB
MIAGMGDDCKSTDDMSQPSIRVGDRVTIGELEEAHIRHVLTTVDSLSEAASVLGIDQATLYRKRKRLGLS